MKTHRKNIHEPGHAHELTFSCYRNFPFLKAEQCCQWLADSIDLARKKYQFQLWAYVFMPDHVHLIVFPHKEFTDIALIRKAIKQPVGQNAIEYLIQNSPEWIPKITRMRGEKTERLFWQSGGGYDRNVESSKTLFSMIDYIHANPVRKRYVEQAFEWKWSSAAWYLNSVAGPLSIDSIPKDWLE
ncbi:transposase [Rubinisphaera sp.]|uniref:REP-associated tyrosine transposase n=1 Tax=Rubinisphaera sp. TaxID=2024857 RepID=UPI000C0EC5EE|nr:transposase [Rubinisphaera sp.]MBV08555.1 hypothetical protein [Rubinisphaera sp.]HCS50240.1 hypothetical protein [Planctomycetaceae bacterium]|tara:strand:+ start:256 stop:810 length:555 start_codon:yes stop_codon:yes gene_type:complete